MTMAMLTRTVTIIPMRRARLTPTMTSVIPGTTTITTAA